MRWQPRRLTQAREEKGLSKTELAQLVGVSRPAVSQWESEDGTEPLGKYLLKLTEVLGKPPSYFYGADVQEPRPQPDSLDDEVLANIDLSKALVIRGATPEDIVAIEELLAARRKVRKARDVIAAAKAPGAKGGPSPREMVEQIDREMKEREERRRRQNGK